MSKIDKKVNQIKGLTGFKGKTEEELQAIATELVKIKDIDICEKFSKKEERKFAKGLLDKYLADYTIETISDKNTLKDIIYLEVLQTRLEDKLNQFFDEDLKAIPLDLIELLHKNTDAISKLKATLGLNKGKDKQNSFDALEHLKKRFKKWRDNNQASRTLKCPYCTKFILLKISTEAWEAMKHPFFKDTVIYNEHLFAHLNEQVVIDRDFIAKVLTVSPDYVDFIINKSRPTIQTVIEDSSGQNNQENKETVQKDEINKNDEQVI